MAGVTAQQFYILGKEVLANTEGLGDLRRSVSEMLRRLEALEQQMATLQAAHESHVVGSVEGLDWTLTVSGFPESEGME